MSGNGPDKNQPASQGSLDTKGPGAQGPTPPALPVKLKLSDQEEENLKPLKAKTEPLKRIVENKKSSKDEVIQARKPLREFEKEFDHEFKVDITELANTLDNLNLPQEDSNYINSELSGLSTNINQLIKDRNASLKVLEKIRNAMTVLHEKSKMALDENNESSLVKEKEKAAREFERDKANLEKQIQKNISLAAKYPNKSDLIAANNDELRGRLNHLESDYEGLNEQLDQEIHMREGLLKDYLSLKGKANRKRDLLANTKKTLFPRAPIAATSKKSTEDEPKENPIHLISDDPKHEAQTNIWRDLLGSGFILENLKAYLLLEDESTQEYDDSFVWRQYQEFVTKSNLNEQNLAAIATGYLYHDPGTCVRFSPLKNAKINESEKEFFEEFLKEIYSKIPELAEREIQDFKAAKPSSAQQINVDDIVQQATVNINQLSQTRPSSQPSSSLPPSSSGAATAAKLKSTPSDNPIAQPAFTSSSAQDKAKRQAAVEEADRIVEERRKKAFAGGVVNPKKRGGDKLIEDETKKLQTDLEDALSFAPTTEEDKTLQANYLKTLETEIDTLRKSISSSKGANPEQDKLIKTQESLIETIEQHLNQTLKEKEAVEQQVQLATKEIERLKKEKGPVETPQSLVQKGDLTSAFQLWAKEHGGSAPSLREANTLVKENNKKLLSQVPTALSSFKNK